MELRRRKTVTIILFILPAFLFFTAFIIYPLIETFQLSFFKWRGIASIPREFVGFENYEKMFNNKLFWSSAKNNMIVIVLSFLLQVPLGLVIANVLSKPIKGLRFFKVAFFMPHVLSATAVALMWKFILHPKNGLLNIILEMINLEFLTRSWLADPDTALYSVVFVMSWQGLGIIIILLLAGIVSIPQSIIESSQLDGVKGFQYFFYIVIPYLWDVFKVITVMIVINGLKAFDVVYVLTGGEPFHKSDVLTTHMYNEAFLNQKFGMGSAVAISILVLCLGFTLIINVFMNRED